MKAEIITIGDEILIGQIVDSNSAWLGEQLNARGIKVRQINSISDQHEHIIATLERAEKEADLVIITGGLGPTKDDLTKHSLCEYFNATLVFHAKTLEHIKKRFAKRGIPLNELNREQAMLPESCTVLHNELGTAPGMWFEKNNTLFVAMPGVPYEMKYVVENELLPRLKERVKGKAIFHKTVLTQGIPESVLAEKIEAWENNLPEEIKLAYLPNPMSVRLRLSARGNDEAQLKVEVEKQIDKLKLLIPDAIFGYDKETMAEVVGNLLVQQKQTLAVAESCTGGYMSHLITAVAGSSDYYKGAVTSYSNEIKQKVLGVQETSLEKYGAVSEQVAREMAQGVKNLMQSDYAVATTGIAGPGGGTPEKPVGTVWIALAGPEKTIARKFTFVGDHRERNIVRSAQTALQLLRQMIVEDM